MKGFLSWTDEHTLLEEISSGEDRHIFIVDFDETLWLRNSTEEFLDHARPRLIVSLLLQLLGFLKPWRLAGAANAAHYRDQIRVGVVVAFMPWTILTWQNAVRRIGLKYANRPLLEAMSSKDENHPIYVASHGFQFIIEPILRQIGEDFALIAHSPIFFGINPRKTGKRFILQSKFDPSVLKRAVFISDSSLDADMKGSCGQVFFTKWRNSLYLQSGNYPMLPLAYTSKIKRPNENYILHGVVGYDFIVGLLAYVLPSPTPIRTAIAFSFYLVGFFAIYEIGYFENDTYAVKHEELPKVSKGLATLGEAYSVRWAWAFGLLLLGFGAMAQTWPDALAFASLQGKNFLPFLEHWGLAIVLVVLTRLTFRLFNSLRPRLRILPMFALQVQRTLGYALFLPTMWVGVLLCTSHAFARWIPYVIYRYGGNRDGFPAHLCAFLLFLSFGGIAFAVESAASRQSTALFFVVTLTYLALRAARDLAKFVREP